MRHKAGLEADEEEQRMARRDEGRPPFCTTIFWPTRILHITKNTCRLNTSSLVQAREERLLALREIEISNGFSHVGGYWAGIGARLDDPDPPTRCLLDDDDDDGDPLPPAPPSSPFETDGGEGQA